MNKADLIARLAPKLNINQDHARIVVNTVLETLAEGLSEDKNVRLVDFGSFTVKHRKARQGRNPKTGEPVEIKESEIVRFSPGKALTESVNSKIKPKK